MRVSYRTRRAFRHAAVALLILLLLAVLVWICWTVWLGRFVIYTREGAKLDFSLGAVPVGQTALPPDGGSPVGIYYNEGEDAIRPMGELEQLIGYYVEPEELRKDIEQVKEQIYELPLSVPVLIDVKTIQGGFYYSSNVGETRAGSVDTEAMDELIQFVTRSGRYCIARLPALKDYEYCRNHILDAITDRRGYVWVDTDYCYWMDPTKQNSVSYLIAIINELRSLGFDEVVLTDYDIPEEAHVIFSADRAQVLSDLANTLLASCGSNSFAVSFVKTRDFTLPEGRTRQYITGADASNLAGIVAATGLPDPEVRVVFLADNNDTRFEDYSVVRPLSTAH